jgi:hypothetical protein
MRNRRFVSILLGTIFAAGCAVVPSFAQEPYPPPQQQYPPQQYPQQPPPGQYPPPQYPQGQGQYPPPQQYPPAQGQYPPPQNPQAQYGQPPLLPPQQLDQLVQPIALYPDGLLAQVLTASTFSYQIPEAAAWANQHAYLHGDALARAIQEDNLPWDPSVIALLPFPSVLNYMAQYMGWTQELGNAVLAQRGDVMDAVQRMRQEAYNYGYLRSNPYMRVDVLGPNYIEILPVAPGYYYVPYYNPYVVFVRPRPGFAVAGAIRFGPGVTIGAAFAPWGWGGVGFGWREHTILIDHRPWERRWDNRAVYVHPYAERPHYVGPRVEHHEVWHDHDYDHEHRDHR